MPSDPPLLPETNTPEPSFRQSDTQGKWDLGRLALIITVAATALLALSVLVLVATSVNKAPPSVNPVFVDNSSVEVNIGTGGGIVPPPQPPPSPSPPPESACDLSKDQERFDCIPEGGASEATCMIRRCCWRPDSQGVPSCYFPSNYQHYHFTKHEAKPTGSSSSLTRTETSGFPNDIRDLLLDVTYVSPKVLRIKIYDPNNARYEPPFPEIRNTATGSVETNTYKVTFGLVSASFTIQRNEDKGTVLFDTSLAPLVFSDQFIQISTRLCSRFLYGLGEHMDHLLRGLQPRKYSFFNYGDVPTGNPEENLYGHHPFYLIMEDDGRSHGVFLHNSNAMDILVHQSSALTYRTIGGVLDFYLFTGPTPEEVVQQYTGLVGRPFLPPYWSLGFHLCRYDYGSTNVTRETFERNLKAGIPVEVMWNDIDYMDNFKDFTIDPINYGDLPDFVNDLHKDDRHYVMMFDPGLSDIEKNGTYPPYDEAVKYDLLIKQADGKVLRDKVWTRDTVFPDYTNPNFPDYWREQFQRFHYTIQFDGAWVDMNEPDCFVDGSFDGCPMDNPLEMPIYVPGGRPLQHSTICMSAQHHTSSHYNLHNIFGSLETRSTHYALKAVRSRRPFIISRTTAPGHGHYGGHWTGDITSSWEHMRLTVPAILNFNMYGIPMVGADICGFLGNTTEELCLRWSQLGAFYPFSRNHNDRNAIPQDPASMGPRVIEAAKIALEQRYYLLPYLYSLFFISSMNGSTVVRPLFFEFPKDRLTYSIETQFLWGPALMIMPVLWPEQIVTAYFPKGIWYDYYTGKALNSVGEFVRLPADLKTINLAIRGGYIIPAQETNTSAAVSDSRRKPFHLLVALDENGDAQGQLFSDDGDSVDNNRYNNVLLKTERSVLTNTVVANGYALPLPLGKVLIMGVKQQPLKVIINGSPTTDWSYKPNQVLEIDTHKNYLNLLSEFTISWS